MLQSKLGIFELSSYLLFVITLYLGNCPYAVHFTMSSWWKIDWNKYFQCSNNCISYLRVSRWSHDLSVFLCWFGPKFSAFRSAQFFNVCQTTGSMTCGIKKIIADVMEFSCMPIEVLDVVSIISAPCCMPKHIFSSDISTYSYGHLRNFMFEQICYRWHNYAGTCF